MLALAGGSETVHQQLDPSLFLRGRRPPKDWRGASRVLTTQIGMNCDSAGLEDTIVGCQEGNTKNIDIVIKDDDALLRVDHSRDYR